MTVSSGIRFIVQHHLACMKNLHLRCACQSISQSRQKSNDDWKDVICTRFMLKIDLNLFRIFNALMEHRSVTRAAHHLGVTQPAVSHALTRLRKALDDPLFIRAQSGLQPTARAEEIADGVRRGLLHLRNALAPTTFNPTVAERHFTIAAGNYFCTLLIPALVERLRLEAPAVSLRLVPSSEMLIPALDGGTIDLALGGWLDAPRRIIVEPLYRERMVWIASTDNPITRGDIPPERIDGAMRIKIVPSKPFEVAGRIGEDTASATDQMKRSPLEPGDHRITVYDPQTAVALVARTDLIALVPEKVAVLAAALGRIVTIGGGIREAAPYQMALIWHARHRADQGLAWLRDRIREAAFEETSANDE
jgi:DNA-binding transcriptional LysR family regulator